MPTPARLLALIDTFGRNLDSYLDPDYKETELRREFLDPLFTALGWDMDNAAGYAEAYKDVVHEETLKISGVAATAPDYSFRIGGTRKFFVEAARPNPAIERRFVEARMSPCRLAMKRASGPRFILND